MGAAACLRRRMKAKLGSAPVPSASRSGKPILAAVVLALTLSGSNLAGQEQPRIAVEVKTVSVLATVRDRHGKIVPDLAKDDFLLVEDGRPQVINYFAREKDLPLRLGLRRVLDQERSASYAFLDNLLRADKDVAAVVNFDRDVTLLQDFTSSRPKLQTALQQLETPRMDTQGGRGPNPRGTGGARRGGGTLLYDAVYLASDELMNN